MSKSRLARDNVALEIPIGGVLNANVVNLILEFEPQNIIKRQFDNVLNELLSFYHYDYWQKQGRLFVDTHCFVEHCSLPISGYVIDFSLQDLKSNIVPYLFINHSGQEDVYLYETDTDEVICQECWIQATRRVYIL